MIESDPSMFGPDGPRKIFAAPHAYLPTGRAITVDTSKLSGLTTAGRYELASARHSDVADSPYPNAGSRSFAPPGRSSDRYNDWTLVLESAAVQ